MTVPKLPEVNIKMKSLEFLKRSRQGDDQVRPLYHVPRHQQSSTATARHPTLSCGTVLPTHTTYSEDDTPIRSPASELCLRPPRLQLKLPRCAGAPETRLESRLETLLDVEHKAHVCVLASRVRDRAQPAQSGVPAGQHHPVEEASKSQVGCQTGVPLR